MNAQLFQGELVCLAALNPETDAEAIARWSRDSEYWRLAFPTPARPRLTKRVKEELEKTSDATEFAIRALADDRFIGVIGLYGIRWTHREAWVGIHIGERAYWGRGYGTDAMRVILRYAFTELNLYRISLNVLADNTRARRSYEKAGFVIEGSVRRASQYDGRGWDEAYMGLLRDEWERVTSDK